MGNTASGPFFLPEPSRSFGAFERGYDDPMSLRPVMESLPTLAAGLAAALLVAACGFTMFGGTPPIPVGPVGPVVANPNGGPPIECRDIPIEQCLSSGGVDGQDVARIIVTCTKVCTPTDGEYRLDLLKADGRIEQAGGGAYASAPAAAPNPPASAPST
jgi:hypothetical protein